MSEKKPQSLSHSVLRIVVRADESIPHSVDLVAVRIC
jgi:hypothetical protein